MNPFAGSAKTSIKQRMLNAIGVSLAIAIITSACILSIFAVRNAKQNLIEDISTIGKIIANRAVVAAVFNDKKRALENLQSTKYHNDIDQLCQYNAEGRLFVTHTNKKNRTQLACSDSHKHPTKLTIVDTENFLLVEVPIVQTDEIIGHLDFYSDKKSVMQAILLFASVLMGTLLVALSVAYIFGRHLVKFSLLPLTELFETSQEIARSPYSNIRAKKSTQDEIGNLVDVFNQILDNLESDNKALTASESRFRVLAEHAPIGIFLKNTDMTFEYTNEQWSEITGLKNNETNTFYGHIEKKDLELYKSLQELAKSHRTPQVIEYNFVTPNGNYRTLMEHIAPLSNHQGFNGLIGSLLDATALKNAQLELEKLDFYDPLTSLPNRRFFRGHLELSIESAKKHSSKLVILMTDLDNFKKVNDSLGHDAGDQLLSIISQRLKSSLSKTDVVSRMGGDEFMILLKQVETANQLDNKVNRILHTLRKTVVIQGQNIDISGSIGIAVYPTDGTTYEELMRFSDIALYNAKSRGGNTAFYYSSDLDKHIKEKVRLENKLRKAVKNKLLHVFIQPIYETSTQNLVKGEALVRWLDDEEGYIPPDKFIPLAEETGLIFDIGKIVMEKTIAFIHTNKNALNNIGLTSITINLSARQFFSSRLVAFIKNMLTHYGVEASYVEFELTESMVMDDVDKAISIMRAIRRLGCKLSIDDFGTGYSSLAYLKKFPIDYLKIDRSFIKDIPEDKNDIEIACSIIAMGHKLGMQVVAEGVETREQFNLLRKEKCDYVQGYYFSKPTPLNELIITKSLSSHRH